MKSSRTGSQYYSRAADRYRDIVSTSGSELTDITWLEGCIPVVNPSWLQAEHTDEESVKIADSAISNLEEMAEMMQDLEQIEAIKKTLTGMRGCGLRIANKSLEASQFNCRFHRIPYGGASLPGEAGVTSARAEETQVCYRGGAAKENPTEQLKDSIPAETNRKGIQLDCDGRGFESATGLENAAT